MTDTGITRRHALTRAGLAGVAGAAGLAALVPTATVASAATGDHDNDLVGTWLGTGTLTGLPPSFGTLLCFADGGTLSHSTAVDLQAGQVSTPSYGAWARTHAKTYAARFFFFTFDAQTNPSGSGEVTERLTVHGDHLRGTLILRLFDTGGNQIFTVPGTLVAKRVKAR